MEDKQKNIEKNIQPEAPADTLNEAAFEANETAEKKVPEEYHDAAALKEAIEKTDIDDALKLQAAAHAQALQNEPATEQVKKLIDIAGRKGIAYAVHVAQKTGDAYLVDALHDALADGGYYKKFKL